MASLNRREFMIPTATNVVNLVSQNIADNLRRRQDSDIVLPSLYRLAYAIHYNTGEFLVTRGLSENSDVTE